jgi:hypothetical protein
LDSVLVDTVSMRMDWGDELDTHILLSSCSMVLTAQS